MLAAVPAADAACGDPAGPEPPCPGGIYRDVADMLVLMAVFAVGWLLFSPGTRLGLSALRLFGWGPALPKAAPRVEGAELCCAASAGARPEEERRGAALAGELLLASPAERRSWPPAAAAKGEDSAEASRPGTPSTCSEEAAIEDVTPPCLPHSGQDSGDEPFLGEGLIFEWDFEATGNTSPARTSWAGPCAAAAGAEDVDAWLRALAAGADLAACWSLWHAMPPGTSLGEATCVALASAVERRATTPADAEYALEVAEASGSAQLAEAALAAGARLRGAAWLARALPRLYAAGVPRRPRHATALARAYGRERRADLAVELWRRGRQGEAAAAGESSEGEEGEEDLYAAALEACAAAGDFEAAARLARGAEWRSPRSAAGQRALLSLARWLARRQDLPAARRCAAAARAAGAAPELTTLRSLLAASARSADMAQARAVFDEILNEGLTPDVRTYSAMICGYCTIGSLDKALGHFEAMRAQGLRPDAPAVEALLDACASRSMVDLAEKVLAEMEAVGVALSNAALAALLRLYGGAGDLDRALAVFEELPRRHGLEVSGQAHGALVAACLSAGRRDLALEAFGRAARAGCRPGARTFESLIASCVRQGDLEEAVKLVDDALMLTPPGAPARGAARRVLLDTATVEDLLRLIGRRRQARRLGIPLLARLQAAGFTVSERLVEALLRSAEPGGEPSPSPFESRRVERESWCRDFLSTPAPPLQ